ncbi:kinase-like domain-containing protein [Mycena epipterygia]|nr:kinase-like domain-containing protein [Mycena epipterygia]
MASNVAHSPRIAQDISALGHGMFHPMPVTTTPIPASLPRMNILDCVEQHVMDRLQIPQNLIVYIFSLPHQLPQRRLYEIQDRLDQWVEWDTLTSLANYRSVVEILFSILCDILLRHSLRSRHAIAEEVFERLREDVFAVYEQLTSILRDSETYKSFYACRGALAQQLLDLLQDLLDAFPDSSARPLLSKALLRLSHASGLHPTCFALSGLQKVGQQVAAGAFGDVWKGLVRGQSVCVKIVRLFRDADVKAALQGFSREALIWRQLSHPNLLPFFGLYYLDSRLCLVSPWMENGHIIEFLRNAPADTNRASLMLDIARGLEYLHCKRVVHGDLKGMNILVTPSRRACVADFGLSSIADALTLRFTHSTASAQRGTVRYQAPELILAESPNHFASDVYAFACVCYEILTGKVPFYEISQDVAVMYKVVQGLRPSPPETMPLDSLWVLLQDCWEQKSANRPDVTQIIQRLVGPPIGAKTTHSTTDWDETFSSRFRRSLQDWPLLPLVTGIERRIFGEELAEACVECFPPPVTTPKNQAESSSKRPPLSPSSDYPPPAPALKSTMACKAPSGRA